MSFTDMSGVAMIAGAGSGLGKETAYVFAERGARAVVFADLILSAAEQAAAESRKFAKHPEYHAHPVKIDTTDKKLVDSVIEEVMKTHGRIDYFVNSAGIAPKTDLLFLNANLDEFDSLHAVNTKGVLVMTAAIAAVMKEQAEIFVDGRSGKCSLGRGSIVTIASIAGSIAMVNAIQYSSSKAGAVMVTKAAAKELSGTGVRVNCVSPGWVKTPMYDMMAERDDTLHERTNNMPMKRAACAEEVAGVCHFLCSADASYVHGSDWGIDGGLRC